MFIFLYHPYYAITMKSTTERKNEAEREGGEME